MGWDLNGCLDCGRGAQQRPLPSLPPHVVKLTPIQSSALTLQNDAGAAIISKCQPSLFRLTGYFLPGCEDDSSRAVSEIVNLRRKGAVVVRASSFSAIHAGKNQREISPSPSRRLRFNFNPLGGYELRAEWG